MAAYDASLGEVPDDASPRTVERPREHADVSDARVVAAARAHLTLTPEMAAAVGAPVQAIDPIAAAFLGPHALSHGQAFSYASAHARVLPNALAAAAPLHVPAPFERTASPTVHVSSPAALLWFPCDVHFDELRDAALHPPRYAYSVTGARKRISEAPSEQLGREVRVNAHDIALFRHGSAVLAFAARCPHARGHIALGDIEEFSGRLCVCCPMHGFLFSAQDGACVAPAGRYHLATYPTRVEDGRIAIGFASMASELFSRDDF